MMENQVAEKKLHNFCANKENFQSYIEQNESQVPEEYE